MGHQSPTMITVETSFPPNGSSMSHHGYRRKEFPLKKGHQPPTIVTEERSFPAKGSLKAFNGYRRKEFSAQRVIKVPQWLPRKGVFRPKGHQPPTMVTEERGFPLNLSLKSLIRFPPGPVLSISSSHFLWTSNFHSSIC
ncbi:hypothetical protein BWZ43_07095 [Heyndrickxia oleronia]|uniref:Uncharacterized protein n=1 Tax=Heyndrickxia oleronia TaxID=38875 RepID=A0A8E2LGC6_9BACI|nr:hypothetical protein BWZ43_07095 [Heyndrickxia oleronia]